MQLSNLKKTIQVKVLLYTHNAYVIFILLAITCHIQVAYFFDLHNHLYLNVNSKTNYVAKKRSHRWFNLEVNLEKQINNLHPFLDFFLSVHVCVHLYIKFGFCAILLNDLIIRAKNMQSLEQFMSSLDVESREKKLNSHCYWPKWH